MSYYLPKQEPKLIVNELYMEDPKRPCKECGKVMEFHVTNWASKQATVSFYCDGCHIHIVSTVSNK